MSKEVKTVPTDAKALAAEMMATFEAYKQANDERLAEIESKSSADTLIDDKLRKLDKRIDYLSLKSARPPESEAAPDTREQNAAWSRYIRNGDESGLARLDTKAFSSASDSQGGYLAPPELDRMIEARLMQASPMRQIATVRQTSAGTFRKPVALGVSADWATETQTRREAYTDGFSLLEFPAGELYSMPAATQALLEDSYADIDEWLAEEVETAFSQQESEAFISGDGASKPKGLLEYPIVSDTSHSWGKIGAIDGDFSLSTAGDQLIDLIHAPKSQFRSNGRFVLNRRTAAAVRKLKDGDGRYIWSPSANGETATILGYPVTEIENMPDIGDGEPAIAFGDFRRGYLITDRQGARVLRDPFSLKPYVLFYTTKRVGGGVQNFDAIKVMQF
ncbi:MAG: phage major capsid protein [Pseudomonadota bacterium]